MAEPPTFTFYPKFPDDWDGFSRRAREAVGEFLKTLEQKYNDPEFQRECELSGRYWGAWLPEIEFRIIWQIVYPAHDSSQPATDIYILACESIPGPKKSPRR
jgi:hypothetical protein